MAFTTEPRTVLEDLTQWWVAMEEDGLTWEELRAATEEPDRRRRILQAWRGNIPSVPEELAGPTCDARRVAALLGISYTEQQLAGFGPPPRPQPGYLTFWDPGWSIVALRDIVEDKGIFHEQNWYDREPFATKVEQPRYRQVWMEAAEDCFNKSFAEQTALLSADEKVPSARVVIMAMAVAFLRGGHRFFPDYYVRTTDRSSGGNRVHVGNFGRDGLDVNDDADDDRYSHVGLAVARKVS